MLMNACCCDPTCIIFKDDFDRGNSNDIGANWTETGTVEISSNQLRMTGSGTAITALSHISELMVVRVVLSIGGGTIGTKSSEIIVNYKDSSNYHFVRIDGVYSGLATPIRTDLKFYKRSAGVDTQLGSTRVLDAANVITSIDITVCFDGAYLSAAGFREATTKIVDGFKAGLSATAAATAINWNNFRWYKYDVGCPNCIANPQCGYCFDNSEPTGIVILDFGAATLTDSGWNACDQIQGEYILSLNESGRCDSFVPPNCCWGYSGASGTYTDIWCSAKLITFGLTATIQADGFGQSLWSVEASATVPLHAGCRFAPCGFIGSCVIMSASYRGNHSVHGVCDETPLTLTKQSQFFNAQPSCTGLLPATIELRLA